MDVLLIQPPDAERPVPPRDSAYGHSVRFVPNWDLLCARAYLHQRTRHLAHFIDTRFFGKLERGLAQTLADHPQARLAVIHATSTGIGQVAAVAGILKQLRPDLRTAICGPHPSRFPDLARVPHVDYALCGDPEPILRNLIDSFDAEQRLRRVPGLSTALQQAVEAYWLPDLKSLNLPDWDGVSWPGYRLPPPRQGALAELQLARGHSREVRDRTCGGAAEPLRVWPFDRVAAAMQKARHAGVVEVFLSDPPGFWTARRFADWVRALDAATNTVPWSLQLSPEPVPEDLLPALQLNCCRRIEFLFPTAEPALWPSFGLSLDLARLSAHIQQLQALGIEVEARFEIGGPEATPAEPAAVVQALKELRFCPFSLHPATVEFDAPLYREQAAAGVPSHEAWMNWAREPWTAEKPTALWGGAKAVKQIGAAMDRVEGAVMRSPRRRWLRLLDALRSVRVIESMETAALQAVSRRTSPGIDQ